VREEKEEKQERKRRRTKERFRIMFTLLWFLTSILFIKRNPAWEITFPRWPREMGATISRL